MNIIKPISLYLLISLSIAGTIVLISKALSRFGYLTQQDYTKFKIAACEMSLSFFLFLTIVFVLREFARFDYLCQQSNLFSTLFDMAVLYISLGIARVVRKVSKHYLKRRFTSDLKEQQETILK